MNSPEQPAGAARSGVEVARQALAAAKAEAKRRGLAGSAGRTGVRRVAGAENGFRGPRRSPSDQLSGAHPDERDPQPLDSTLERLLAERGWATEVAVGSVMGRWATIVGRDLAEHCEPVSFDDGQLVVQAQSTAWATQLRLLATALVRRLNEELGAGTVTAVRVLGPRAPSWKRGRLSVRGRGARDTYG
jgi:predicted nucleic acid-binding Zn ribbon protein